MSTIATKKLGDITSDIPAQPTTAESIRAKVNTGGASRSNDSREALAVSQRTADRPVERPGEERSSPTESLRNYDAIKRRLVSDILPPLTLRLPDEWHLLWASTAPDAPVSIHDLVERGYTPVRPEDLVESVSHLIEEAGDFTNVIRRREMVLMKTPRDIYDFIMTELHHNEPAKAQESLFLENSKSGMKTEYAGVNNPIHDREKGIAGLIPAGQSAGATATAKAFFAPKSWSG